MKLIHRLVSNLFFNSLILVPLTIAYLLNSPSSFAQDETLILEKKLPLMEDDTAKVNVLIKLGKLKCSIENDKALMYLQEAFTISTSLNFTDGIGRSLMWQGRVYYYKDDYPLSNKYFDKAEEYLKIDRLKDDLSFLYFVKGENYRINGDYIRALESYKKALELAEETGNMKYKSTFYSSIGRVLLDRNEPRKAMTYLKVGLKQKKSIDDNQGVSNNYTCLGMAYEQLDNLDSSLWYHNEALKIRVELNNERAIAGSEYNKAGILIKMKKYREAEQSSRIARKNFAKFDEKTGIIIADLRLAIARSNLGQKDAIELAESSLKSAQEIDNPSLISHAYRVISRIYFLQKKYDLSYEFLSMHKKLDDSLFNIEKERFLTEFEEKFQSERKDREIEFYKAENKIQNQNIILLIVLLITAIGFAVLLFFLFRLKSTTVKRQNKLIEQEQVIHEQESKIAEKENQLLQEQLEAKNRELASKALEMLRLNDTITTIIEKLDRFNHSVDKNSEISKHIKDIIQELETQTKQNIWNEFNQIFKNIHSDFYSKLLEICPDLTATEIKTAALLKLNLTSKEIAAISFKSEGGVKTTRYRLRKKLNLSSDEKLIPFLMQI